MVQEETFHSKRRCQPDCEVFARKKINMKKYKKLVALALALVMMFSFMAMSASAANIEIPEIQPMGTCNYCKYGYVTTETKYVDTTYPAVTSCPNRNIPHNHTQTNYKIFAECSYCGCTEVSKYYTTYCPYE